MQIVAYGLYLAFTAFCVLMREYQLRTVLTANTFNKTEMMVAGTVLAAVLVLALFSFMMVKVRAKLSTGALPGVLVSLLSVPVLLYGGYSVYLCVRADAGIFSIAANSSYIALGVGLMGAGLYMRRRGKKTAGFLMLLSLLWPTTWLLYFVATKLVFIHQVSDLLNLAFLLSGCLFYLELCSKWCVPDSAQHQKRTVFLGFFHLGLFAMANLPDCVYAFLRGDITGTLYLNTAFFAVYLLCIFIICIYLRSTQTEKAAQEPPLSAAPQTGGTGAQRDEIVKFFDKQPALKTTPEKEEHWLSEAENVPPKRVEESELFAEVSPASPHLPEESVGGAAAADTPLKQEGELEKILSEVKSKKKEPKHQSAQKFIYQPKSTDKKPSRFKK